METQKHTTCLLILMTLFMGIPVLSIAQVTLPEFTVNVARYKYLNAVNPEESAQPVNMLEHYVAAYDLKSADFYEEVYDNYFVSFFIPNGKILAAYDKDGTLLRTVEKYKDVAVPNNIRQAVSKRFPNWAIVEDVYIVTYMEGRSNNRKVYKLKLENSGQRLKIKIDDQGNFL